MRVSEAPPTPVRGIGRIGARVAVLDLGHRFPGTDWLFEHLEVQLLPGRTTAIVGPSGSGKSTFLSLLAGWETPAAGRIERHAVASIGWVFQNPHGVARRTALDHVVLPLLAHGLRRRDAQREGLDLMAAFHLAEVAERPFQALSGGEAQRLMLARAVAKRPSLLLVDEPTAQLDQRTAAGVNEVLGALAREEMIVVVATHDPATRDACDVVIDLASAGRAAGGESEASDGGPAGRTQPRAEEVADVW